MSMEFEHRSAIIVRTFDVACLMWSVTLKCVFLLGEGGSRIVVDGTGLGEVLRGVWFHSTG